MKCHVSLEADSTDELMRLELHHYNEKKGGMMLAIPGVHIRAGILCLMGQTA